MAVGGGGGTAWIKALVVGGVLIGGASWLEHSGLGPPWVAAALLAVGGLLVVFGSCESMIKAVEGIGRRLDWNQFVAGTMAGLASNIPEVVMLGFVLAATPRVGFIVVMMTLHVGAMAFGIYSGLLPRDATGHAKLPVPLVKLSTDLYAAAAAVFLVTGALMVCLNVFDAGQHDGEGFGTVDLYVLGGSLLFIELVAVVRLVQRFSEDRDVDHLDDVAAAYEASAGVDADHLDDGPEEEVPTIGSIVFHGLVGIVTSVVGGHAVGEFAHVLVTSLTGAGYSEMVGALILSIFACAGAYVMIATAHVKGMYDIALANVSGAVTQVPFVVLPVALILLAIFAQTGVIPTLPNGGVLAIDLSTTVVVFLAFPPLLILWKAVQDDGTVNWVETASMVSIFSLTLYFLARHG